MIINSKNDFLRGHNVVTRLPILPVSVFFNFMNISCVITFWQTLNIKVLQSTYCDMRSYPIMGQSSNNATN